MSVVCPKCNKNLPDGAKFCDYCGTRIPQQPAEVAAPNSGAQKNAGQMPEAAKPSAKQFSDTAASATSEVKKGKKRSIKRVLAFCGIGVAVIIVLLVAAIALFSGSGGGDNYILYIKDSEIYCVGLSGEEPWQITTNLINDIDASDSDTASNSYWIGQGCTLTENGKLLFFPDKLSSLSNSYSLYYRDMTNSNQESKKIASNVEYFYVDENGTTVIYATASGQNLYEYDVKSESKEKIDSNVTWISVSEDAKTVVYLTDDAAYWKQSGEDKEKIDSDVSDIVTTSEDLKTVIYLKDDALYRRELGENKEELVKDVASVYAASESGTAYYTKLVEDDDNASRSQLYYYDGQEEVCISEEFFSALASLGEQGILVYKTESFESYIAIDGEETMIADQWVIYATLDEEGSAVYYLQDVDEQHGDLYQMTISDGVVSAPKLYDSDVFLDCSVVDGQLIYFKNVQNVFSITSMQNISSGDMYINKERIDYDVQRKSVQCLNAMVIYYSDWESNNSCGTLNIVEEGESVKISDDVAQAYITSAGDVIYLKDYSTESYMGDLYRYSGSEEQRLDKDVTAILSYRTQNRTYSFA